MAELLTEETDRILDDMEILLNVADGGMRKAG